MHTGIVRKIYIKKLKAKLSLELFSHNKSISEKKQNCQFKIQRCVQGRGVKVHA